MKKTILLALSFFITMTAAAGIFAPKTRHKKKTHAHKQLARLHDAVASPRSHARKPRRSTRAWHARWARPSRFDMPPEMQGSLAPGEPTGGAFSSRFR